MKKTRFTTTLRLKSGDDEKIEEILTRLNVKEPTETPSHLTNKTGLKMPKIDLPKFTGKYKDWVPFYDQLKSAVDKNDSISSDVQKLNYLEASLQGEAAEILSHLPLTNSNYRIGLKLLEDQYSNKRLKLKSHMDAILQAPPLCIE